MQSGRVEHYARRQRLKCVLDEQLRDPRSEVVQAIVKKLRAMGLSRVSGEEVAQYFGVDISPPPPSDAYSLDKLAEDAEKLATGKKPSSITFPDGQTREVDHWSALAVAVIEWFGKRLPPSPQPRSAGSKRYLYNDSKSHYQKPMVFPKQVHVAGRTLFVELNAGARGHLSALVYLCKCVGEQPSGFRIRLRE